MKPLETIFTIILVLLLPLTKLLQKLDEFEAKRHERLHKKLDTEGKISE